MIQNRRKQNTLLETTMDELKQEKAELKETEYNSVECQAREEEYDVIFIVSNNENGPTILQKYPGSENEGCHMCKVCGEQFVKNDALQEHLKSHIEEVYICNICGETCSELSVFEEHQKSHTAHQYLYVICEENFPNNGAKETVNVTEVKSDHMYNREDNATELAESNAIGFCRMEEELVSNANDVEISLIKEQENADYTCEACGKKFLQNAQYQKHKKIHERERDRSLVCDTCGRQFSRTSCLNDHKKIHTGERPYTCDTCGRSFAQSSILQRHKRIHSGEQPYVCPICGQKFTQSAGLHRHQRVHLGERHICDICHKGYTRKTGLILHRRLHTGEQPYACEKCKKRFTKNSYLQKHIVKCHIKAEVNL
ncbi:zinc finger protein 154-like isoform X2 [Centruroides vittatus]|uniref:zinc finger protein 154-like isoform X2 n=1 Tax=Centruroides vittatus TaxID=120091 RepID=UPI00350FBD81